MPDLRPSIEREQVLALLHQHFSEPVTNLLPLEGSQVALPFYEERVLCYECYTALDALRFFAKKGDEQAYQWTRQRILQL
jgi:hygromycin-B 4-O-kinase